MNKERIIGYIESGIRFFIYLLIFWLPYSTAVVESCVIIALLLWLVKRGLAYGPGIFRKNGWTEQIRGLFSALKPVRSPLNKPIAFFLLACVLSIPASRIWPLSLRGFFTKTLEWFVVYFLVIEAFSKAEHIRRAVIVFLVTTTAVVLDGFVQYYWTGTDIFLGREITRGGATAGFHHANSLAAYLAMMLPMSAAVFAMSGTQKGKRFLLCVLAAGAGWLLGLTFSRAGWLSAAAGMAVFVVLSSKKWAGVLFGAVIVAGCLGSMLGGNPKVKERLSGRELHSHLLWRLNIWEDSLAMIRERPFFGHGLNTYMRLFQDYRRRPQNRLFSETYAHNCYIQMAAETGLLGLLGFVWIVLSFFKTMMRLARAKLLPADNALRILALGLGSGTVSILVHSFFDVDLYTLQLSVLTWTGIGLYLSAYNLLNGGKFYDRTVNIFKE